MSRQSALRRRAPPSSDDGCISSVPAAMIGKGAGQDRHAIGVLDLEQREGVRMPTELRRIVFTGEELRVALDNYLMRKGTPLPPGVIAGVRMTGADGGSVVFDIRDTWDGVSNPVEIASRHVGAALIRYCKICKIPLPKDAGKSLSISGDNLALDIRSGRSQAPTVTNIGVDDGGAERS